MGVKRLVCKTDVTLPLLLGVSSKFNFKWLNFVFNVH